MNFTVAIHERRAGNYITWRTLGLGPYDVVRTHPSEVRLQQTVTAALKRTIGALEAQEIGAFVAPRGVRLEHVRVSLSFGGNRGRRWSNSIPLVLEPRWTAREHRIVVAYHPAYPDDWFTTDDSEPLEERARRMFEHAWEDLDPEDLASLVSAKRESVRTISFEANPKSAFDRLAEARGTFGDLDLGEESAPGLRVLPAIGTNLTLRAIEDTLRSGAPRERLLASVRRLIGGAAKRPAVLVGPPGAGKKTLVHQLVLDLLESDDYATHHNLDRVQHVWEISGKRIIAGMAHLGEWEKRCADLLHDARGGRIILFVEDLHAFGRIGQTRESQRSLAQFFRGPIARGELAMIAVATPEQLMSLEQDAPAFAALFATLHVDPATREETLELLIQEARTLERVHRIAIQPSVFRNVLELGAAVSVGSVFPGCAVELLREAAAAGSDVVFPFHVHLAVSERTGLPPWMIEPGYELDARALTSVLSAAVVGQPEAIDAAVDLIFRIRTGLTDPRRPYGVLLFTGPTGTGKTELAKSIAEYLYGSIARLIRIDMSEHAGPDAAARLVGDRFEPDGLLTRPVREQPYGVVLLDEIEKADPSVLNLLLQVFDEGRLTDAAGNVADFRRTVVIMTSNLGSRARPAVGFEGSPDDARADVARAVREFFPPELFNRIDRVVRFGPLSHEAALAIAEKELGALAARRGLTQRNIFVTASPSLLERVVKEGFDPNFGARPLKRHIEEEIGTRIVEHISRGVAPAELSMIRLYPSQQGVTLHIEVLETAPQHEGSFALEPLLERPVADLEGALPGALAVLERLETSGALDQISARIVSGLADHDAEDLYNLDALRARMAAARAALGGDDASHAAMDQDEDELDRWSRPEQRLRYTPRRSVRPGATTKARTRDELLDLVAEATFLERAVHFVDDSTRHAVFVELVRVGMEGSRGRLRSADEGLFSSLARAYLEGPGELESFAAMLPQGRIVTGSAKDEVPLEASPSAVVLELVGLCIRDLLEPETGSHVWRSATEGTQLVRVKVWPVDSGARPSDLLARHAAARAALDAAIESGADELPENPIGLLPAVRVITSEPAETEGTLGAVHIEDHALGYATTTRTASLAEALRPLWRLHKSRRVEGVR